MSKELIYKLLWATIEDFVGLWEIDWEINANLKEGSKLNNELVKKILLYLLEIELIKLYYDKWGDDQLKEISKQEAIEIIKGKEFWFPPEVNGVCVKIGSTEKGEKYYYEKLVKDIDFL